MSRTISVRRMLGVIAGPARAPILSSAAVKQRSRFVAAGLAKRRGLHVYDVKSQSDLMVLIRHVSEQDGFVLSEVFGDIDAYVIPSEIRAVLAPTGVEKIVDLGGNIGMTALRFLREFRDARLLAVEADPTNVPLLEANLALNNLLDRARVIRAAAYTHDGTLRFVSGQGGESHVAGAGEHATVQVPSIDIFPELADCDLLKLDIEGGEWAILADERFAATGVKALCMEYHAHMAPKKDLLSAVRELLARAGFRIVQSSDQPELGLGFLWACR